MIGARVSMWQQLRRILSAKAADATYRNLSHAAASVRKTATTEIKTSRTIRGYRRIKTKTGKSKIIKLYTPSPRGTPPYTRRGLMRRAIRFDVSKNKRSAIVGPRASIVGTSGEAHEFGRVYKGTNYPERPFMQPAMISNLDRMAADWAGAIRS